MPNPTAVPITPPRIPFLNPETGFVSQPWYLFLLSLNQLTSGSNVSLGDVQKGPPTLTVDEVNAVVDKASADLAPAQDGLLEQIAELQKQVEGLQMAPPPRQFAASRYGSFYDTTTQAATVINTATAITFNTTDLSSGVFLSTTSRVMVDTAGLYNFALSFQIDKTSGGVGQFFIFFRLNGVDVADSAGLIRIQSNNAEIFSAYNLFLELKAGDYIEIMFSVDDLSVELHAVAATPPVPGIPSIILTVNNNIGGFQ